MARDQRLESARLNDSPEERRKLLTPIVRQAKLKARKGGGPNEGSPSTAALFVGPPGTGKTMAAHAVANELGLDLIHINLRGLVSKFIGETEKNLRDVFEKASAAGAVLFFDEADALFGKRTEVGDSHDRFANIEVGFLLQRLEEFPGLVILATNRKDAIDPAFLRRLRFVVDFPRPEPRSSAC